MRSEAEVVADVIVELARRQLISKAQLPGVLRALQVPTQLVRERAERRERGLPYDRPSGALPPPPGNRAKPGPKPKEQPVEELGDLDPDPKPKKSISPYKRSRRRPSQTDLNGMEWLFCTRCPDPDDQARANQESIGIDPTPPAGLEGHWAPITLFRIKPVKVGSETIRRMPYCVEGHRRYMRERRVTAAAVENLKKVGVVLSIDADSSIIGLKCAGCDEPFRPNDEVDVRGEPYHLACRS